MSRPEHQGSPPQAARRSAAANSNDRELSSSAENDNEPTNLRVSDPQEDDDTGSYDEFIELLAVMGRHKHAKGASPNVVARYEKYKDAGRWLPRGISPVCDVKSMLTVGITLFDIPEEDWELTGELGKYEYDEILKFVKQYNAFQAMCPVITAQLALFENKPDAIADLAEFLESKGGKARTDDVQKVKDSCLKYLPELGRSDIQNPPDNLAKELRGFENLATGRLLTPRSMRDVFDDNPTQFCLKARLGERAFDADDFATFLYPEHHYDAGDPSEHLLMSPYLLANFRAMYQGKKSASTGQGESSSKANAGRPVLFKMWKVQTVTPEYICYCAFILRFGLTSQRFWDENDGEHIGKQFYNNLMLLFEDEAWTKKTLAWWNKEIFGKMTHELAPNGNPVQRRNGPSMLELIKIRRLERARAASATPALTSRGPSEQIEGAADARDDEAQETTAHEGDQGSHSGEEEDEGEGGGSGDGDGDGGAH
ncbi:uncharacterized protein B0H18DRAFT_1120969 [Fomitopsis serialis]|uniref:uncharacterized protein n=1 Tax=Fomitopsis serialis TaxID=139415 RepID=UPI00200841AF|nr:uncharacterized protein B0H18DRAFT_1120969 [Neoantrodia serialis]KAH9922412.1 hypothetical protein B0H18DRAFT_1120969 [Neoantrodia serialis]